MAVHIAFENATSVGEEHLLYTNPYLGGWLKEHSSSVAGMLVAVSASLYNWVHTSRHIPYRPPWT